MGEDRGPSSQIVSPMRLECVENVLRSDRIFRSIDAKHKILEITRLSKSVFLIYT
jgi:hypothetical protein